VLSRIHHHLPEAEWVILEKAAEEEAAEQEERRKAS
jgi:hypothetical protein